MTFLRIGLVLLTASTCGLSQGPLLCTPPPSNMVGWWPGDGNYTDIIGGNNGTPVGGVTFAPGKVGQAFSFNGIGAVQVPNSSSLLLGAGEITLDAWINRPPWNGSNPPSGFGTIVAKVSLSYPYQLYSLTTNPDNRAQFAASDCGTPACGWFDGGPKWQVISVSVIADNTWHHVAGVRRADGTREIWVDGVLENTRSEAMGNTDSDNALYIGDEDGSGHYSFTGLVDEVEVFNRALSALEIQAIYNAGSAGKCKCQPPTITTLAANQNVLWPPNHKMVPVNVSVTTSGGCGTVSCKIVSVTSNEPVDPDGDWLVTGNLTVELRADRLGLGDGRIYTVTVQCTDASGNTSTNTVTVTVPHDQGH